MSFVLTKCSEPGWDKVFATKAEAIAELRRHICQMCFNGDEFPGDLPVDVVHDGRTVECWDADTLLSTSCGLEYELTDEFAA